MIKLPTKDEANYFREIMNGDKALTEIDEKYLEEWYLINHDKKGLHNIFIKEKKTDTVKSESAQKREEKKERKRALEYYMKLLELCLRTSMNFSQTIYKLIYIEIEMEIKKQDIKEKDWTLFINDFGFKYRNKILDRFNEINDSPEVRALMMEGDVGEMIDETMKNSFDEIKRFISYYINRLKPPFSDIAIDVNIEALISEKDKFHRLFTNNMKFTKLINNNHGLAPLIRKDQDFFHVQGDKIIYGPFVRGMIIGLIKKIIIQSIKKKNHKYKNKYIIELNDSINYLSKGNADGNLSSNIDDLKNIILFLEWGLEHKGAIEYFYIAKYMGLSPIEVQRFAAKLDNDGDSLEANIKNLMASEVYDISIERLIDITDQEDRKLLLGIEDTNI